MMTEWPEFHLPDLDRMSEIMKGKVIFDGRNIYDADQLRGKGFIYFSIGRK
jgi:UDPglucose 6-dehydrogenase